MNSARFRCGSCRKDAQTGKINSFLLLFCLLIFLINIDVPKSLEWRRVSGADGILDSYTPSEVFKQYFSMSYIGNDKFSCPSKYNIKNFNTKHSMYYPEYDNMNIYLPGRS